MPPATELVLAPLLFQANSCPQGATHRAALVSAAVRLKDVSELTGVLSDSRGLCRFITLCDWAPPRLATASKMVSDFLFSPGAGPIFDEGR